MSRYLKLIIFTIIIFFLLASNLFFALNFYDLRHEIKALRSRLRVCQNNEKVLNFTRLFIEKVLKAQEEIDFETRLQLENAVRSINDEEILNQWKKFTQSQTEEEAQKEVVELLDLLVKKIKPF